MRAMAFLLAILFLLPTGCASLFSPSRTSSQRDEFDADRLWRQGYGYNNPNPRRLREGKRPLNFDGTEDSWEQAGKDLFGQIIAAAVVETFRGIGRGIRSLANRH